MTWGPLPDPAKDYRAHLALQAKKMNCWIYSKNTKMWYTPEEFIWSKEDINVHRGKANAPQLILMDPREGLLRRRILYL